MTDAVITAGPGEETEAEEAERAIDEKAYGFWIYLMSDAIFFALLFGRTLTVGFDREHQKPNSEHDASNH